MKNLRTPEATEKYTAYLEENMPLKGCPLCEREPIKSFTYWKIIPNYFPYDVIAERHDMLVPLRHVTEKELTPEEYEELLRIKEEHLNTYHYLIEATPGNKSIPTHLHLHLIVAKPPKR